ncbi:hypothetical protein BH20ACT11_BH20ACT11_12230 [soil metagenome]
MLGVGWHRTHLELPEMYYLSELSVREGFRIVSSYPLGDTSTKVWIITEADRSSTCILLPEEY